jgi:hypothetical protein
MRTRLSRPDLALIPIAPTLHAGLCASSTLTRMRRCRWKTLGLSAQSESTGAFSAYGRSLGRAAKIASQRPPRRRDLSPHVPGRRARPAIRGNVNEGIESRNSWITRHPEVGMFAVKLTGTPYALRWNCQFSIRATPTSRQLELAETTLDAASTALPPGVGVVVGAISVLQWVRGSIPLSRPRIPIA